LAAIAVLNDNAVEAIAAEPARCCAKCRLVMPLGVEN
jgi:hypothetical protein